METYHDIEPDLPSPETRSSYPGQRSRGVAARERVLFRRLMAVVVVSTLIGAGSALAVARTTGWGTQKVVQRTVTLPGSAIVERPTGIPSILQKVLPAVVSITSTSRETNPFFLGGGSSEVTAQGTGVIVGANGEIVTNDHVVDGATSITVTLNGSSKRRTAKLIGADAANDLAVLEVSGENHLPTVTFADSTTAAVGDDVIAIGYSLGLSGGPTVTDGIISATGRKVSTLTAAGTDETLTGMLQTDAAISSGNSGGPLVNARSQVVGINTMVAASTRESTAQNIGFAIPAGTVESLLPRLRKG